MTRLIDEAWKAEIDRPYSGSWAIFEGDTRIADGLTKENAIKIVELHNNTNVYVDSLEEKLAHQTYHCQANLDELKRITRMLHEKEQEFKKLELKKFAKFDNEECWIYQGDGSDNLETLCCPVVINPKVLIGLITTTPAVGQGEWSDYLPIPDDYYEDDYTN